MNYKYKYGEKIKLPIIELVALEIKIPENNLISEDDNSSSIVNTILSEKEDTSFHSSYFHSSAFNYSNHEKANGQSDSKMANDKSYLI